MPAHVSRAMRIAGRDEGIAPSDWIGQEVGMPFCGSTLRFMAAFAVPKDPCENFTMTPAPFLGRAKFLPYLSLTYFYTQGKEVLVMGFLVVERATSART